MLGWHPGTCACSSLPPFALRCGEHGVPPTARNTEEEWNGVLGRNGAEYLYAVSTDYLRMKQNSCHLSCCGGMRTEYLGGNENEVPWRGRTAYLPPMKRASIYWKAPAMTTWSIISKPNGEDPEVYYVYGARKGEHPNYRVGFR